MSGDVTQKHLCVHGYDREKERESKPLTIPPQPPWIVLYPGQCAKEKGPVISGNIPICAESAVLILWVHKSCPSISNQCWDDTATLYTDFCEHNINKNKKH